ncbi:MAG: hypothetical protein CDV28_11447 [Candidatus Electronema aureum]|uniref:Uncharacterized protein n=1 Tax=Candidatus Electronema aureum TaxID=2005002 RepID=A0A521G1R6_9BACT|nr:MAG: hypothetical protein CDV28_11447 [Candidatus Electronema aureum]
MHRNKCWIGITALVLSFLSLLLTVFPSCLIQQRIFVLERKLYDETAAYSFDIQSCDNGKGYTCLTEAEKYAAEIKCLYRRLRICNLAMILFACAAIGTAAWSSRKERVKEFCLFSIASSSVALSWQYVGAVFAVSIALFVFTVLTVKLN